MGMSAHDCDWGENAFETWVGEVSEPGAEILSLNDQESSNRLRYRIA